MAILSFNSTHKVQLKYYDAILHSKPILKPANRNFTLFDIVNIFDIVDYSIGNIYSSEDNFFSPLRHQPKILRMHG